MGPLERRRLGRSSVEVTRFGFGGAPMGERFVPVDNATADAILQQACAEGINYFDTARQYGQGKSEAKVGRIETVCRRHGVPLPAAALQSPLAHPLVAAIIPGAHTTLRSCSRTLPTSAIRSRGRCGPSSKPRGCCAPTRRLRVRDVRRLSHVGMIRRELIGHVLIQSGEAKEDRARMRILGALGLFAACLGLLSIPLGVPDSRQHRQLRLACIQIRHDPLTFRLPGSLPRTTAMVTPTLRLSRPTDKAERRLRSGRLPEQI